ncbi:signal transduction histidine kinase [Rubidibacter lacunae KORDI 51-2]|uniref:histidine kinase n=1 Tax=Rubidibacter lacunae KORDI 51-2 TaxID=582515 RepID=U5DQ22_9CHRO|nr:HAMP domain-containing sensor histidine kinase [Rubidibacter lacunae]ERN42704.1 signal transduction histidine kinase [Rubidibacter lacunae KORDI 51-2]
MQAGWLPTVIEAIAQTDSDAVAGMPADASELAAARRAYREWTAAVVALGQLIAESATSGVVLSGPSPLLATEVLGPTWHAAAFVPADMQRRQLPGATTVPAGHRAIALPLAPGDPLGAECFGLVICDRFCLTLALGLTATGAIAFQFSFAPEAARVAWANLQPRVAAACPERAAALSAAWAAQPQPQPDYRLVTQFARRILQALPSDDAVPERPTMPATSRELELLQAFTHEVRTPLATIRILARSALKRAELDAGIAKRLQAIDRECTAQIERMELIFQVMELDSKSHRDRSRPAKVRLAPVALERVLQQSIPHWQQQARRRNVALSVALPETLPAVVSDPALLDRILTGLMDCFTSGIPIGAQVQVRVTTAGDRLKLQVRAKGGCMLARTGEAQPSPKLLGRVLLLRPETGGLSLNLDATKHLFQIIGGKLTVRHHPDAGEVLTIFLPLNEVASAASPPALARETEVAASETVSTSDFTR